MYYKTIRRTLALSLILILLFNITGIAATPTISSDTQVVSKKEEISLSNVPQIVGYEKAVQNKHKYRLREEEANLYTVVFENEDGTKTMYNYGHPVKYVKNEKIIDKDNTLKKTLYKLQTYYSNTQNDIVSYLPQKLNKPIHMDLDGYKVSIQPQNVVNVNKAVVEKDSITYPNAYGPSTALKYTAIYSGLKEEIILSEHTGQTEFTFLIDIGDCVIRTLDDDCLYIYDEKAKTYRGLIEPVYIVDATGRAEINNELTYQQTDTTEWQITVKANKEFLESPDTVYPVSIDPTITHANTSVHDATVYSGDINSNYGESGSLFVGRKPTSQGTSRVLMKFPALNLGADITASLVNSAYVELCDLECEEEEVTVQCYTFTGSAWDESSVTWVNSNMNATSFSSSYLLDSQVVSYEIGNAKTSKHRYSFEITEAVKEWTYYGFGSKNKGIVFKSSNESQTSYKTFGAYDRATYNPYLSITYGNPPAQTISNGVYYIRNKETGKYLDVMNGGTTSGTNVTQWSFNGYLPQQWKVTRQSDGYYTLEPQHTTGFGLDVKTNYSQQGSIIDIWAMNTIGNFHKFLIEPVVLEDDEDGETSSGQNEPTYRISTKVSNDNYCLTVMYGDTANNADIGQVEYVGAATQAWYFESNIFINEENGYTLLTDPTDATGYELSNVRVSISCDDYYTPLVREAIAIWNQKLGEGNGISITEDENSLNIIKTELYFNEDDPDKLAVYKPLIKDEDTGLTTKFEIRLYSNRLEGYGYQGEYKRRFIIQTIVHEIGHAFGLDDNPPSNNYRTVSIMTYDLNSEYYYTPQKADVAGAYAFKKYRDQL